MLVATPGRFWSWHAPEQQSPLEKHRPPVVQLDAAAHFPPSQTFVQQSPFTWHDCPFGVQATPAQTEFSHRPVQQVPSSVHASPAALQEDTSTHWPPVRVQLETTRAPAI